MTQLEYPASTCTKCHLIALRARLEVLMDRAEMLSCQIPSSYSPSNIHHHQRPDDNPNLVSHCPGCGVDLGDTPASSAEIDKLKQLICAPTKYKSDSAQAAKDDHNEEVLTRVATKMYAAMRLAGEQSVDKLVGSRLQGMMGYFEEPLRPEHTVKSVGSILYDQEWTGNASRGMIPDYTTLDNDNTSIEFISRFIFETMLLVDYGFPPCPIQAPVSHRRSGEDFFGHVSTEFEPFCRFLTVIACH